MIYLGQQNIVHRDLALRNILVAIVGGKQECKYVVKISGKSTVVVVVECGLK